MPGVGSTAFASAGEVMDLVRSLLNDIDFPQLAANITPTGATRTANVVTIQTAAAHGLTVGIRVTLAGVTDMTFNGTFTVATVPSASQFTFAQTAANASSGNGTVTPQSVGDVFVDAVLLPHLNAAYHELQTELAENGVANQIEEIELDVDVGVTAITDTSTPQLPVDFLAVAKLWEKVRGAANDTYRSMDPRSPLPNALASDFLGVYDQRADGLYLLGALQNLTLRLRYVRLLAELAHRDSQALIRGCKWALAYGTAMLAANAKGAAGSSSFAALYQGAVAKLLNIEIRSQQYRPVRRRPYRGGRRAAY